MYTCTHVSVCHIYTCIYIIKNIYIHMCVCVCVCVCMIHYKELAQATVKAEKLQVCSWRPGKLSLK